MPSSLALIELLLVFSGGLVWGLFELRSLRRSRTGSPKRSTTDPPPPPV